MAKKSNHSIFTKIAFFVNIIFAISLLVSYLAVYVSPDKFWLIAFFGLAYPFLLLINLLFFIFWLILFKKGLFLSLIIILFGFNYINKTIQFSSKHLKEDSESIKVLSYNVRLFNIFKPAKNDKEILKNRNDIFNVIREDSSDILCFQEFVSDKLEKFTTLDTILKFQNAKNYNIVYSLNNNKKRFSSGIVTFSKYPIINKGKVKFNEKSDNLCIFSDIVKETDTIRIYNVHLESIRLSKEDEMFYEDFGNQSEQTEFKLGVRKIFAKLKHAFIKRASQARSIAEHIRQSPYPVIVCGDFNDTPTSYAYHIISENLKDAFVESGIGIGNSYNGKFPSFRIDYILYSNDFSAYDFEVKSADYSDHYPIIAKIVRNRK